MNNETNFCLRVDVDTFEGLKKGIPKVIEITEKFDLPITIYLSLGKYATGRNLFRRIKNRDKFDFRIPPWERNSIRSLFRGVLLPARKISEKEKNFLRNIQKDERIEIHPHGYNHVKWSSKFSDFSYEETFKIMDNLSKEYKSIFEVKPIANAAPNFTINSHYFKLFKKYEFKFGSDFKHTLPFILKVPDSNVEIMQLPVTELTIEEHISSGMSTDKILKEYQLKFDEYTNKTKEYVCFYLHAIYEPIKLEKILTAIIEYVIKKGMNATTHSTYAEGCSNLPKIDLARMVAK